MANLQQFTVTSEGAAQVTVPSYAITARVEEDDGTVLADFTGPNALQLAGVRFEHGRWKDTDEPHYWNLINGVV